MSTTCSPRRDREMAGIFFPDDIIVEILRRLPAESVFRFRLVCKGWRDLTSTLDFMELHMNRSFPTILVSNRTTRGYENVFLDKWWKPSPKRFAFRRLDVRSNYAEKYGALFSHGGLMVFQEGREQKFLICNPTCNETVTVTIKPPKELSHIGICGVFFHPLLKEYCTLWRLCLGYKMYYKMLNLGSKPCWREISNPWSQRVNMIGTSSPVLIDDHLYWLVRKRGFLSNPRPDIMAFDIRSEKFVLMDCPVPSDLDYKGCKSNLSEIDGVLSFVLISRKRKRIDSLIQVDIWKLKDYAQQLWVSMNPRTIKVDEFSDGKMYNLYPTAAAAVGEKLVIYSDQSYYFWNHNLRTTKTSVKNYNPISTFCHVMTLTSLRNCKSKICMDIIEGEVPEESDN